MLIRCEAVTKIYSNTETRAVDGISIEIERGEFVAVVGTSGSGKSTLLHIVGGIERPTSGKVIIDGTDIYTLPPDRLTVFRRRAIGFVFQRYNLIPNLSVWENVALPLGLDNIKPKPGEIEELLETLGIADKADSIPSRLSGGQQQRAAIARALVTKPHIILADEPTGSLDSRTGMGVMLTLASLNERFAQTIVVVTHNEELAQTASRRIRIEDGRVVSDSKAETDKGFTDVSNSTPDISHAPDTNHTSKTSSAPDTSSAPNTSSAPDTSSALGTSSAPDQNSAPSPTSTHDQSKGGEHT